MFLLCAMVAVRLSASEVASFLSEVNANSCLCGTAGKGSSPQENAKPFQSRIEPHQSGRIDTPSSSKILPHKYILCKRQRSIHQDELAPTRPLLCPLGLLRSKNFMNLGNYKICRKTSLHTSFDFVRLNNIFFFLRIHFHYIS